jgi:HSP20 family protein
MSLSLFRTFDDHLIDTVFNRAWTDFRVNKSMAIDLKENESEYTILANSPGVRKEAISVTFKNDILTIAIEVEEREDKDQKWHFTERAYGKMTRRVQFPNGAVDAEKIDATVKNGVLYLTLPKTTTHANKTTNVVIK